MSFVLPSSSRMLQVAIPPGGEGRAGEGPGLRLADADLGRATTEDEAASLSPTVRWQTCLVALQSRKLPLRISESPTSP